MDTTLLGPIKCGVCGYCSVHEAASAPDAVLRGHVEWTRECLTCGQTQWPKYDTAVWEAVDDAKQTMAEQVAAAVTRYGRGVRAGLDLARAPVFSAAGLWLLLASVADNATSPLAEELSDILALDAELAAERARALLTSESKEIGAAVGVWSSVPLTDRLSLPGGVQPLPPQADLDAWASRHTRGLIEKFPIEVTGPVALLLATALAIEPRWRKPLRWVNDDMLELNYGIQTIIDTQAAGLVAVAKPFTKGGVDVFSVIAAPQVAPAQVWDAVEEVVARANAGNLWHQGRPADLLAEGHAWRRWETTESVPAPAGEDAPKRVERWTSLLPAWEAAAITELDDAPGVAQTVAALLPLLPPETPGDYQAVQAAVARYDEEGFRAAAVTALGIALGAMPQLVDVRVERVELDFSRPHAVIAVARGGAWDGIPLFTSWVTEEQRCQRPDPLAKLGNG